MESHVFQKDLDIHMTIRLELYLNFNGNWSKWKWKCNVAKSLEDPPHFVGSTKRVVCDASTQSSMNLSISAVFPRFESRKFQQAKEDIKRPYNICIEYME